MSEEKKAPEDGVKIPDNADPAVERALSNGWMEQVDWDASDKDPADWVDARQFNVRGELMGKIQGMGRKLNTLEQENAKLLKAQAVSSDVTRKMVERQYDKAMADLKLQRREAYEVGDFEALEDIDERRDELKAKREEMVEPEPEPKKPPFDVAAMHPIERSFMDIVQTTPELRNDPEAAQKLGIYADTIWGANPDISILEFTQKVSEHLNPSREPGPQSPDGNRSGVRRPARAGSRYTLNDLDDMERSMAETFVDTGAFDSVQEYIDIMAKTGELSIQKQR